MADQVDSQNSTSADSADTTSQSSTADSVDATPQRLPGDHPLVTAFEAQKTKNSALQAQVDQIPAVVATALRQHLIQVHQISEATAATLITGTTPEAVISQVQAVTGLTAPTGAAGPLLGTTVQTPPSEQADFVSKLFGGTDS